MAAYTYKATTFDGKIIEGILEAADDRAAVSKLQDMGYIPIKVSTEAKKRQLQVSFKLELPWRKDRIGNKDLLIFTQELYTLVKSGLPLDRSLAILAELSEKEALRRIVSDVLKEIKGGKSLSEALSAYPAAFPRLYVNMVRAGEAGGVLDQVLERLIAFLESAEELRSYFISALIYPLLLTFVGSASILVLVLFVVPEFAKIFADSGVPVPLPMQILMTSSQIMRGYWWLVAALIAAGVLGFRSYIRTEEGRMRWDRRKLRLPIIGGLLLKIEVARFARTLGTLLRSAVPLLQAMNIVKDIVGNRAIAATMDSIKAGIKKGEGLAIPIRESGVFPAFALHLLEVGEESGKLDAMLLQIADAYDREIRTSIKSLIAFFEPAMILIMGVVIGTIVVSMLMAIFSVYNVPL